MSSGSSSSDASIIHTHNRVCLIIRAMKTSRVVQMRAAVVVVAVAAVLSTAIVIAVVAAALVAQAVAAHGITTAVGMTPRN